MPAHSGAINRHSPLQAEKRATHEALGAYSGGSV